ncbi:flagellar hook-length control protein FliK [Bacillus sp. SM2101]|uniref:flagellar hook-length control protein FliK n=1 Tax=Bacillus sp. SM2101 TaxID=2805366 RepID=UPI001BDE2CFC|nr:flagellar hook-length control protein FliK [Bacillus sp. SM2101]
MSVQLLQPVSVSQKKAKDNFLDTTPNDSGFKEKLSGAMSSKDQGNSTNVTKEDQDKGVNVNGNNNSVVQHNEKAHVAQEMKEQDIDYINEQLDQLLAADVSELSNEELLLLIDNMANNLTIRQDLLLTLQGQGKLSEDILTAIERVANSLKNDGTVSQQLLMKVVENLKNLTNQLQGASGRNNDSLSTLKQLLNSLVNASSEMVKEQNKTSNHDVKTNGRQQFFIGADNRLNIELTKGNSTVPASQNNNLLLSGMTLKQPIEAITQPVVNVDIPQGQMDKIQQFVLFVGQPDKGANQEQFIKDFQNILAKGNLSFLNGNKTLQIKLFPEHLGSLRIELQQTEAGMLARIITSSTAAKELIESQLFNLKQSFQAQNIQVDKLVISDQLEQQFMRFLNRDQNDQQRQNQSEQDDQNDNQANDEPLSFEEVLLNLQV